MVGVGVVIVNVGSAVETRSLGGNRNLSRIRSLGRIRNLGRIRSLGGSRNLGRLKCIGGVRVEQYTMSTAFYFGILGSNESSARSREITGDGLHCENISLLIESRRPIRR